MNNLSDLTKKPKYSVLIVGVPGTGKTTLALSVFPKPFLLDCDDNAYGPVRYLTDNDIPIEGKISTPIFGEDGEMLKREAWLDNAVKELDKAFKDPEIETIIIDSLTLLCEMVLVKVLSEQGRSLGDLLLGETGAQMSDDTMQIQDWGAFRNAMTQFIMGVKSCGKHVVFTGHIKDQKDPVTSSMFTTIAVPGSTANIIAGFFAEAWLLESESSGYGETLKQERRIKTFPPDAMSKKLGLKSASGLPNNTTINAEEVKKYLFG